MSSFNNNQVNELFPGLGKIMQGYTGSLNSEASVYGHSQPAGPSASPTQESVLSPETSSMCKEFHTLHKYQDTHKLSGYSFKPENYILICRYKI
ncbi:hypothetical protein DSO57_1027790 [Entomophthora muscae]|uniref:Uncharacterized protein n=1 Tax=Entomophthora muscae TaxID=34485 RepID=A0ACC2T1K6_9FUNG|nr:hypothetical protein DSO57_1027790 [Entomophthora muscae]